MVNTRIGFGHDRYAYYKLYKIYSYIKISYYIGSTHYYSTAGGSSFAGHEQKGIFIIIVGRYIYIDTILFNTLLVAQRFHSAYTNYNH